MTTITEGITPTQFLVAVNSNFALILANYTTITSAMNGAALQTAINNNFSKSDTLIGIKGSSFISTLNNNFGAYTISAFKPTNLAVSWINDFARITFNDTSGGTAEHEIWENKNGSGFTLVHTLATGVVTYDYYTWQNATLNFKIKAKNGTLYSGYSDVVTLQTPFVLKTDQTTLTAIQILQLTLNAPLAGKNIHIDWGDGTSYDVTAIGNDAVPIDKTYTVTGNYFIILSGNTNDIYIWQMFNQTALAGTDISKWIYPPTLYFAHLYTNGFIGDITDIVYPSNSGGLHLAFNYLTADITNWVFPNVWWDFHIQISAPGLYTGDITNWDMPEATSHMSIAGYITGNLTNWRLFVAPTYSQIVASLVSGHPTGFTGDISGWLIPTWAGQVAPTQLTFNIGCHFTKLPRGNFRWVDIYSFYNNNCNTAELDSLLAYIDAYFVGGVVPVCNCVYTLNGAGMGIPSAAGLASRTSIIDKYTAAGKTATIVVNAPIDYYNSGGLGDRRLIINITKTLNISGDLSELIDGVLNGTANSTPSGAVVGLYLNFDFGSGARKIITETTLRKQYITALGTFKWKGSNEESVTPSSGSFSDISGSFVLGGAGIAIDTSLSANTTGYRHYRLEGVSGNSSVLNLYEFEFKIGVA